MMAYQMRHDPSNQKIKELMESGAVGRISLVRRRHCIPCFSTRPLSMARRGRHLHPVQNMGMFMDDASHATDFLHWIWVAQRV